MDMDLNNRLTEDETLEQAYDIFLELAADNLDPADIILFNLQFEERGGAEAAAKTMKLDFLGRVPLSMGIRLASDGGVPPAAGTDPTGEPFHAIAAKVADWLEARKQRK